MSQSRMERGPIFKAQRSPNGLGVRNLRPILARYVTAATLGSNIIGTELPADGLMSQRFDGGSWL
jgi:hypothetical protein